MAREPAAAAESQRLEAELALTFKEMVQRLIAALGHPATAGDPLLSLPPPISGKTWSGRAR